MSYHADVDDARVVVDRVDDAVVSDANSPQIRRSLQLDTPGRPRIGGECLNTRDDPPRHAHLKPFELAPGRASEDNPVLTHAGAGA